MPVRKLLFSAFALILSCWFVGRTDQARGEQPPAGAEIHNDRLSVRLTEASSDQGRGFAITRVGQPAGAAPSITGRLTAAGGTARVVPVQDAHFGSGESLEVTYADGHRDWITLFPKLPLVLLRSTLTNTGSEAKVLNRVPLFTATAAPGPAADMKVLGTGGLTPPEKCPGSYAWLAVVEPKSRNGVVAGWITHDRASGVIFPEIEGDRIKILARLDYGKLRIQPGKTVETETYALGWFDDARLGLEAWADAVARAYAIHLRPLPTGYCTWYSEKHGGASDQKALAELTAWAAKTLKPYGFGFVQIDDGWQMGNSGHNGPRKNFTQYNPKGSYSDGMKATADFIRAQGLTAGVWFMPFSGTFNDPWFAAHQDHADLTGDARENQVVGEVLDHIAQSHSTPASYMDDARKDLEAERRHREPPQQAAG